MSDLLRSTARGEPAASARILLLWFCLVGLLPTHAGAAGSRSPVAVRPAHPRLLVVRGDLPHLQRQIIAYPDEWKRVQSAALSQPGDAGYGDARALVNAALAFLITREDRYRVSAAGMADNLCRHHRPDTYASPEALFALALAYDWCYSGLSEAQRQEIRQGILRIADYLRDQIWRHSDFNNHFVLEKVWPSLYAGLALYGDTTDARVGDYLTLGSDYLHQHLLPAANRMAGNHGGQFEGYGYDAWGYMRPMAWIFEAWRTATGENLFPSCTATRNAALWNLYGLRPFDHKLEHLEDADLDHAWSGADEGAFIYLLARRYRDGYAQWMGDQIPRRYDAVLWPLILWRDPGLAPRPPSDLPTARRFEPLGWVLMRSSWREDATFASFQCGPFLTGHQHLDNNAFTLHKRALLAIDSGVNAYGENTKTDYRANYYSRTIAHNSLLVFDPREVFPGGAWAGEATGGANDGGQMRRSGLERVGEAKATGRCSTGRIVAFRQGPLFTYVVGDATRSYSPAKLRLFRRHFLYLPPDLFVVFDQVEATSAAFRKVWLLHSIEQPAVQGRIATITNGPGRLVCRTVLPERPVITRVGGPGKECWVDGRNWPAVEKAWTRDAGAWRLEVSPSRPARRDFFLQILQTDGSEITAPGAVSLLRSQGRIGVRIRAQGREYRVTFSPRAASVHLRITAGGRPILDRNM